MDTTGVASGPFTVLTFIAAPALLTNASSVLALSTTQRMLRTRDSMRELLAESENADPKKEETAMLLRQVNRVEAQAGLLLSALHAIYLALGSFAAATFVTLLGAALLLVLAGQILAYLGLALGMVGVAWLIVGSLRLFRATQISLNNIHEEAKIIRERYGPKQ